MKHFVWSLRVRNLRVVLSMVCLGLLPVAGLAGDSPKNEPLLSSILGATGPAGICVHLGCGEGALTAELARSERLAVHGLEADAQKVARARALLEGRGIYGQAAVECWGEPFLPYADNLVNVLVAENPGAVPESELMRVLAPLGTLWVLRDGAWQSRRKPWPAEFDEWTHWRHGADGNMVSRDQAVRTPTGLRWIAGPAQDAGGRKWYYDHVLVTAAGRSFYVYEEKIVARDSFNGRLLWTRAAQAYIFKETGTPFGQKLGTRTSKVRPVAVGNRLYVAMDGQLAALDAATGKTLQTLAAVQVPREIAFQDHQLFISDAGGIRALSPEGKVQWQQGEPARRLVAGDGKVFYLCSNNVVALDAQTGKRLWRTQHVKAPEAVTCSYYRGVLVLERSSWRDDVAGSGVVAFAGESGDLLWEKEYAPGMSHYQETRAFFSGDLVWLQMETSLLPRKVIFRGFDPRTGLPEREVGTRGRHCSVPISTEKYFITGEVEFTDVKSGKQTRAHMTKSACRLPFIPANGLLYTFPVQCECYPMLRGYMGLAQTPEARATSTARLQTGPAFGQAPETAAATEAEAWPMYRRDSFRSGSTDRTLAVTNLRVRWERKVAQQGTGLTAADWEDDPFVPGLVSAPVCASGLLLVAVPDRHRVVALDAAQGTERWAYTAGGRVDTPPTVSGGHCVFGAHDGYVYCLRLADGQLAWRFRAAPSEARIAVYGQMESPWPVGGSVFVENGVAYFAAGRHPNSDGGLRVYALTVREGRVLWEKAITDTGVKNWYSGFLPGTKIKVGLDYEPVDLLVRDGERLAMSRWQFAPDTGEINLAFAQTNYLAFGAMAVPRGLWSYGIRQNKMVQVKPPAVFNAQMFVRGSTNETALLLAGTTLVRANASGELTAGEQSFQLDSALVHDGLIVAYGRLYAATRDGKVYCLGGRE